MPHSFAEILSKAGVEFVAEGGHHHARKGWINFDCPYCSPGFSKFRMGFNIAQKYVNCWLCGRQPLLDTVHKLTGLDYTTLRSMLKGIRAPVDRKAPEAKYTLELPKGIGPLLPPHKEYLRERGYSPKQIEKLWKVQGIGMAPSLSWRLFIPIYFNDAIVSWTTRSISKKATLRYITAKKTQEAMSIKKVLYGEQYCRHTIVINEGPLDAWAVGPGAVSVCGIAYSQAQLAKMIKYPVRVVLFDNEPDAQLRAMKLYNELSIFDGETYNVTLDGNDASASSKQEIAKLRKAFSL